MIQPLPADRAAWLRTRLRRHFAELIRLSGPVIVSRAGVMVMALVDTLMVGRYGTDDLAYISLASGPVNFLMIVGIGLMTGTAVTVANAVGRNDPAGAGAALWRGVPWAAGFGILCFLCLMLTGRPFLMLTGQSDALLDPAGQAVTILAAGLPFALIFVTGAFFLEGLGRPLAAMVVMIAANLLNVLLNWLLIWGIGPLPELGGMGSAWTTTLVRAGTAVAVLLAIAWAIRDRVGFGLDRWPGWRWSAWRRQRAIGYGSAGSQSSESAAFLAMMVFAGMLGATEVAAYSIVINLIGLVFMIAVGIGTATAVRVGQAHGRGDGADMVLAGWTGLALLWLLVGIVALGFWLAPGTVVGVYTGDATLVALAAPALMVAALAVVPDTGQMVMASALRGRGDAFWPAVSHAIAYLGVMMPGGYLLSITLGRGVTGLIEAILLASILSFVALALRFQVLARRLPPLPA